MRGYPMDKGDKAEKKAPPIIIQHSGGATATSFVGNHNQQQDAIRGYTRYNRNGESYSVGVYANITGAEVATAVHVLFPKLRWMILI